MKHHPQEKGTVRDQAEGHGRRVRRMFGEIAARYDLMNRLMTLGRDRAWSREVVLLAGLSPGCRLLDVGTGTGSISLEAASRCSGARITAVDFTRAMLEVGCTRARGLAVSWCQADALSLPFGDGVFDAVTSGYLIRNVSDPLKAFQEQWRVLKPGGRLVCLDTTPPPPGLLTPFIRFHFRTVIPLLGQVIAGNRFAYTYLPETTQAFFEPGRLAEHMRQAGFERVTFRRFMFGTIAIHTALRPH